ncbi:MAG: cytochrome c-type biogenesis protein [Pseudomonadota bacterium]
MRRAWVLVLMALWLISAQGAVDIYSFSAPEQERRYKALIAELRCLVCQNQNIADSNADLAKDLRREIYEMIKAGKTDRDIVDFMVARYGDFVLYNPPVKVKTGFLWAGPLLILAIGVFLLFRTIMRRRLEAEPVLSPEERAKMRRLLDDDGQDS